MGRRDDRGFTVLELVVVLVIVGVLLGIGIPVFINYLNSGSNATAQQNIDSALVASNAYYVEHQNTYRGLCPTRTCGSGAGIGFANVDSSVAAVYGLKASTNPQTVSIWNSRNGLWVIITSMASDTQNCWGVIEDRQAGSVVLGHKATLAHLYFREKPQKSKHPVCFASNPIFRSPVPDVTATSATTWPPAS